VNRHISRRNTEHSYQNQYCSSKIGTSGTPNLWLGKNPGHLASRTNFLGHMDRDMWNQKKKVSVPENSGRIGSLVSLTGEWRKLHNEELHILYSSPNINRQIKSRRMRWAGHVSRMGEGRNVYRVFMGKPEGKRPLERPRHRWEDGIRMDLREIGWRSVDWIQLAQDRNRWRTLVNTVMNLRVLAPRS
jgi:hypothetical protein